MVEIDYSMNSRLLVVGVVVENGCHRPGSKERNRQQTADSRMGVWGIYINIFYIALCRLQYIVVQYIL
jgi:hypothetical protein